MDWLMNKSIDWKAYARDTSNKYITRYLAYAEAHSQATAANHDALEVERFAVLTAMNEADTHAQWQQVRRFMVALDEYLRTRGYWDELRGRLKQSLRAARAMGRLKSESAFMHNLGMLAQDTGDYAEAERLYLQSLEISERLENQADIAHSLHELGRLARKIGNHGKARHLCQRSLDIERELGVGFPRKSGHDNKPRSCIIPLSEEYDDKDQKDLHT